MTTTQHILSVEDDENDVFFLKRAFSAAGAEADIHSARDGREALDYLHIVKNENDIWANRPDPGLVLLDLKIPYVPELEVLRLIRAERRLSSLIVVVLTSSVAESDLAQAYEFGANSYLVKPSCHGKRVEMINVLGRYWLEKNQRPKAAA